MPPAARSNAPARVALRAGERAALVPEQLALDQASAGSRRNRRRRTAPARARSPAWIASASTSLPVPVSPSISTVASDAAMRASTANSRRIADAAAERAPEALAVAERLVDLLRRARRNAACVMPSVIAAPGLRYARADAKPAERSCRSCCRGRAAATPCGADLQHEVVARHRRIGEHERVRLRGADRYLRRRRCTTCSFPLSRPSMTRSDEPVETQLLRRFHVAGSCSSAVIATTGDGA